MRFQFAGNIPPLALALFGSWISTADAGTVRFTDDKNEKVSISRDIDPSTGMLTNTIIVTRKDGRTESTTTKTSPGEDGGFTISLEVVSFDGVATFSTKHVGGRGGGPRGGGGLPGNRGPGGSRGFGGH